MNALVYYIICPPHWTKTPPLGLSYLKVCAQKFNIEVRIIDLNMHIYQHLKYVFNKWLSLNSDFERGLFNFVDTHHPYIIEDVLRLVTHADLIGFSLFQKNKFFTYALIERIKQKLADKQIVIGGPETLWMKLKGKPHTQHVSWVIGEGEDTIHSLLNSSKNLFIEHDEVENLDEIPFLDFSEYNLSRYAPVLPLLSSRGCIKKCTFCTERLLCRRFRQHSPSYMVKQIEQLVDRYKIRTFTFQDSLINANLFWLETFCNLLLKKSISVKWEAQAIVRKDLKKSLARLLKQSGCYNLFIGVESASDHVLSTMNKGFTQKDLCIFLTTLSQAGLHYEISLIVGHPSENETQFRETADFIKRHKSLIPKIAQVNPYVDYFSDNYVIPSSAQEKVKRLLSLFKDNHILYTKSFINNLVYTNGN